MYHRIVSERCPVPGGDSEEARYAIPLEAFEWQLERLVGSKRTGVSMRRVVDQIAGGRAVPEDWIAITFDDGNESDYSHAAPMLSERGFDATFFVCGCRVDADGGLARAMIEEMAAAGMHVGAHGMTHRFLTALDAREEEEELARSRDLLEEITGRPVDHFAPPGGRYHTRTLDTLERLSFRAMCTSVFGFNASGAREPRNAGFVFRRIPVTAATTPSRFDAIVSCAVWSLLPLYARSRALSWLRRAVGETAYRRLRSAGLGR
jgi:peptidoglycan/xylan/chitin deacetylase (PgdA/CDA1 family)